MKKNKGLAYAVLAIIFTLFNVIAFAVPTVKTASFWTAYAFTAIAFASQIVVWNVAFKGADTLKSKFLGIPLISVGIAYLIVQIIAFEIFMALPLTKAWPALVVCALILGVSAICLIGTKVSVTEIKRIDEKVEGNVSFLKSLQIDIELLAASEPDADIKSKLKKLAEKIRFSDPMSNEVLAEIEAKIAAKARELQAAEKKAETLAELDLLITERNKKLKLLK